MDTLNAVFQIVFARYRRRLGDANIGAAWRLARTKVILYLAPSVAAAIVILISAVYAFAGTGTHLEHKSWGRTISVLSGILIFIFLRGRFKGYLLSPPILSSEETKAERRLVRRLWLTSFAIFCAICLIGYSLHRAGVGFLQGL